MSKKGGGVVPFVTAGFPDGAGSAKQAVQLEISNQNKLQADANMIVGGLQNKKFRARRTARHGSVTRRTARHGSKARRTARHGTARHGSKARRTARHGSAKGARRSVTRRAARHGSAKGARRSVSRRAARRGSVKGARGSVKGARGSAKGARRIYRGGLDSENNLIDGEQLAVPQFGPSVGPLNPNTASVVTNSLLLKAQQDSAFDKDISK
jgi:hypothetical protein